MSRTRVIYNSEALFVGPSPATGVAHTTGNIRQLHRVQSASYDFNVARQDVQEFGVLAAIDRVITESPTVNLNFTYLATNAYNESGLGLVTDGSVSAIAALLNKTQDEKNYFILTVPEGQGAAAYAGAPTTNTVIGIGNGFLSSYNFEAAVGGLPTVSCKVEGLNINIYGSSSGQYIPAVNPVDGTQITGYSFTLPTASTGIVGQVSALRPGDISFNLATLPLGLDVSDAKIQRFSIGFDLSREPQNKLGSKFAFSREIRFPVQVNLSIEANVGELTTGTLSDILCNDIDYDMSVSLKKPACNNNGTTALRFDIKGAKFVSQNFNSSIGPNKTATVNWTAQIGSEQETTRGMFISGVQN